MITSTRSWSAYRRWPLFRIVTTAISAMLLLFASLLPWFKNPTGNQPLAWQLPVDLGWQLPLSLLNYGVLCTGCALYILFITLKSWQLIQAEKSYSPRILLAAPRLSLHKHYAIAAMLCIILPLLFLLQFLFIDMDSMARIAYTETQLRLTQIHFGYNASPQLVPIQPFSLNTQYVYDRWILLLDTGGVGLLIPFLSAYMLLYSRSLLPQTSYQAGILRWPISQKRKFALIGLLLAAALFLGKAPLAQLCELQAQHLLNTGDYHGVLSWLDTAYWLNPTLDQLPSYHLERGQAWYYLDSQHLNQDSMAYLAAYDRSQNDFFSSYQQLQTAWNIYPYATWLKDEMAFSLTALAEMPKPLKGNSQIRMKDDEAALRWLNKLAQLDPENFYARYTIGRVYCDIGDYMNCEASMQQVMELTTAIDIQSSADTYIAVSKFGLGDAINAREYLYAAQRADPEYHNNTARELLSGMH